MAYKDYIMKKNVTVAAVILSMLLVSLVWYSVQRHVASRPQALEQAALQRLREETVARNAQTVLLVREANELTERSIQTKVAVEADRLDKLGIKGTEKQRLLDNENARLHRRTGKTVDVFLGSPR